MKALSLALIFCALLASSAHAQYMVSERTGKKLAAVQELMAEDQNAEAKKILDGLSSSRMSDYERALVHQFKGYIASSSDDYAAASASFEKALEGNALPPATQLQLRFNLSQLYMAQQQWKKAISNLELWFKEAEKPNGMAHYNLAVAYYQDEQKKKALAQGKKALALEGDPKESWLSLVLSLYLESSEYKKALPLLEQLVERFPKKSYWTQLSALYAELGQDQNSLAVQQLMYTQGMLGKDSELIRLARLYLYHDLPYRAASVMAKAIEAGQVPADAKSLELLGQSWMAAREFDRALDPMSKAAGLSQDGDLWLRIGQIRMEREEWSEAMAAFQKALEKGDLENPGSTQILLGISAFHQERFDTARSAFTKAAGYTDSKKSADRWLRHVEREVARKNS